MSVILDPLFVNMCTILVDIIYSISLNLNRLNKNIEFENPTIHYAMLSNYTKTAH